MPHSNRIITHWAFVTLEILLFVAAIVSAYLSENHEWGRFAIISGITLLLLVVVKIIEAWPRSMELLAQDDLASTIANSAIEYGVINYFNMQDPLDQARRNEITQSTIQDAHTMWLCANSGASYLDPSLYRHWSFVEKRLNDAVEFRVVLLDPFSDEKRFRNLLNVGGDAFDSKLNLANLVKLWNTYGTLDIRIVPFGMHATVFGTEEVLFFDPYQIGTIGDRIENRSFCLQLSPANPTGGVALYRVFKAHFDTLWRSGEPFPDWFARSAELLPNKLPPLTR